jgi:hypothetical protein
MKPNRLWVTIPLVLLLFVLPPSVRAGYQANYCFPTFTPDRCLSLMQVMENWAQRMFAGLGIGMMKGMAQVFWLLDRAAAFIFSKAVTDNGWLLNLKTQMTNLFADMMPGLIREIAFGSGGLMYISLSIAGLLMMLPMLGGGARFARPERVLSWGVVLSLFFVAGSFGYDFIGQVEGYRHHLVSGIAQGSSLPLDNLILQPMRAGSGDLGFGGDLLDLPPVFDSFYFPEPELLEVTISEGGGLGFGNANIEQLERIESRLAKAGEGVFFAFISGFGAWLLLIVSFTYVILAFTALLLIIFLFAALPLGFFETGGMILNDLIGRYFQVVIQSLTLAIFLRWLSGGLGYIVDVNTVSNALIWLVVLVVMIVVTGAFMNGSLRLLMQSGQSFTRTLNLFGGESPAQQVREGLGGMVSRVAGGVAAVSFLAGRPEVAAVAGALGANAQPARAPQSSSDSRAAEVPRGNVFARNGFDLTPASSQSMPTAARPDPGYTPGYTPVQTANPAMPQATLHAISSRQGWDAVQMRQIEEAARNNASPLEALNQLQRAPGFERADPQELRKAVEAARQRA